MFPNSSLFSVITLCFVAEYEVAFDKFATDGILQYKDIKKFFESVGHVPSQKEIDEAIEIVTKSKRAVKSVLCFMSLYFKVYLSTFLWPI